MTESAGLKLDSQLAPASPIAPKRDDGLSSGLQPAEKSSQPVRGFSPGSFDDVWTARENLFVDSDAHIFKITMHPSEIAGVAEEVARLGGRSVVQTLGIMYASFPKTLTDLSHLAGNIYAKTKVGSVSVIRTSISRLPDLSPPWDKREPIALMQAVKHQFDPNRTLNSGRFLGGI
jgi:hypothetical protein